MFDTHLGGRGLGILDALHTWTQAYIMFLVCGILIYKCRKRMPPPDKLALGLIASNGHFVVMRFNYYTNICLQYHGDSRPKHLLWNNKPLSIDTILCGSSTVPEVREVLLLRLLIVVERTELTQMMLILKKPLPLRLGKVKGTFGTTLLDDIKVRYTSVSFTILTHSVMNVTFLLRRSPLAEDWRLGAKFQ